MTMTSIPKSIFSWNSNLSGDGHCAELAFHWLGERGSITLDGKHYDIHKHGIFSGKWTLANSTGVRVTAEKQSAFTRSFLLKGPSGTVHLNAQSAFGRTMNFSGNGYHGTISPNHIFTRRATISGRLPDFETTCLTTWITLLTWRRMASNNS